MRCAQFYRPEGAHGRSAHNAKGRLSHGLRVKDRLSAIHEDGTVPHVVDFHLEPERGPALHGTRDRLRNAKHHLGRASLPRKRHRIICQY